MRTLQGFFERTRWDETRLRDRLQRIVARDHAHPRSVGVVDESGHPKKGAQTAGVQRQWCGRTGKVDNGVVGVHTSYVAGDFHCLLDSDLFLPESWSADPARRRAAHIPDDVVFRTKQQIALEQIRRALGNGIRVGYWTFDAFHGRDGVFLDALEDLGQNYVAEVPVTFTGWLHEPRVLPRPTPQECNSVGRRRRFPRLARRNAPAGEVRNLVRHSPVFGRQGWRRFCIREGQRGPMIWEVRHAPFYLKHRDGLPARTHTLFVARNTLNPGEVKYFVANAAPDAGVGLEPLLAAGFARWPIERVFQQAKDELGMEPFEMRRVPGSS